MAKIDKTTKIINPNNVYVGKKVYIGKNCIIDPFVYIGENVYIGDNVTIQSGSIIKDNVYISNNCFIGGSNLIRSKVYLGENSVVGFQNEIKNTKIGLNTSISHKCFIGDAIIGDFVKIGCNCITANFNRNQFNLTKIGNNTKIGINCSLISPITIGENCFIAACSVLRKNLEDNKFFKTEYTETIKENRNIF